MLPDDGGSLSGRDVITWFPFRLVRGGVKMLHHHLLSPREPEPSAHLAIMPDDLLFATWEGEPPSKVQEEQQHGNGMIRFSYGEDGAPLLVWWASHGRPQDFRPQKPGRAPTQPCRSSRETAGVCRRASGVALSCFLANGSARQIPGVMIQHRSEQHPDHCISLVLLAQRC